MATMTQSAKPFRRMNGQKSQPRPSVSLIPRNAIFVQKVPVSTTSSVMRSKVRVDGGGSRESSQRFGERLQDALAELDSSRWSAGGRAALTGWGQGGLWELPVTPMVEQLESAAASSGSDDHGSLWLCKQ